jgi:hypothetical protein
MVYAKAQREDMTADEKRTVRAFEGAEGQGLKSDGKVRE